MALKHAIATALLNVGISVALQSDEVGVRALIARLRPVATEYPLIRLGAHGDGGYLLPDDLDGISACFSPGVDQTAAFEAELLGRRIPCFLADASVDCPPIAGVHFTKKFLGVVNDTDTITLDDWVKAHKPSGGDLLLQMDIEGAEWPVLLNVSRETLLRFRILIIEFHDLERLMDKHAFQIIKPTFDRLLQDFHIVHNHPNNYGKTISYRSLVIPRAQEMTFLRKDRAQSTRPVRTFPHPLDAKNDPNSPDVVLPEPWFDVDLAELNQDPEFMSFLNWNTNVVADDLA
jgi:hypothetical protein